MKRIGKIIWIIERRLSEILLLFIVVFVFVAAVLRWTKHPLVWSIDLAQLLFVWICFIGADIALQNEKHIGVDILVKKLPEKVYNKILIITYLMIITFLILVTVYAIHLAILSYKRQFSSLEISYSWATISAPVGCLLMIRTLIKKIYYLITNKTPPVVEEEVVEDKGCASPDDK